MATVWVGLLRSGEYEQGDGYLKQRIDENEKYCCLGILCEHQSKLKTKNKLEKTSGLLGLFGEETEELVLPKKAMSYWGIKGAEGDFDIDKVSWPNSIPESLRVHSSLSDLNDKGATFSQIADFIELNYKLL